MTKTAFIDFKAVREAVGFPAVLSHYELETFGLGDQIKIACPFHKDKKPSCGINNDRGLFNCFGCDAGGHVIDFVLLMEGLDPDDVKDRQQAAHLTAEIGGFDPIDPKRKPVKETPKTKPKSRNRTSKKDKPKDAPDGPNPPLDLSKISMELELDHPFFEEHSITDEMIETFGLGYTAVGIMKGRIVIPIHNPDGDVVAFAGRYAEDDVPETVPRYRLPKAFKKGLELYNIHRANEFASRHVVIVEGFWSAMRLHLEDIPCVALFGTVISEEQVGLLTRSGYRYATVIFDGDDQGRSGSTAVVDTLSQHLYVRRLDLPDDVKPDTMSMDWLARLKP